MSWNWVATNEHYKPRLLRSETKMYGVTFPYSTWQDGPPGWPCRDASGVTANPGSTWHVCNGCGETVASVQNGGDGNSIDRQARDAERAFEFHRRNCHVLNIAGRP